MDDSTSSASANHPFLEAPPETLNVERAIANLIEQTRPKLSPQIENNVEQIESSIARLSSASIDGLQGLTSELQNLQTFLNSEISRVQGEIESAVSGIKIIMETIAPWESPSISPALPPPPPNQVPEPREDRIKPAAVELARPPDAADTVTRRPVISSPARAFRRG